MSYLVLARKFRPQAFTEVSGQEHVTRTLANSIKRNRIAHAYLFAGPRGVGKTSIARIFSKALNCKNGPTATPCCDCTNCQEITQGTSLAVREIDGASHNSVDNVRDLIESFRALPAPGSKYKVYIIDEVHMLSTAAFNALLKSLEEPPPHTVFILATTEIHKIPETVVSRCQRHDFRALSQNDIGDRLVQIADQEKIEVEPEALRMITRLSDGSMRDAQSLLERVRAFCDDKITAAETSKVLGTVEKTILFELSRAVFGRDSAGALALVDRVFSTGIDPGLFLKDFASHFRELLIAAFGGKEALCRMGFSSEEAEDLLKQVADVSRIDLQDLVHLAREGADSAIRSAYPRYSVEALLVRMATREPVESIASILSRMETVAISQPEKFSQIKTPPSTAPSGQVVSRASKVESAASVTTPLMATSSNSSSAPTPIIKEFDWAAFVGKTGQMGGRFLVEQLKRISVIKFEAGILEAFGPEYSVQTLTQAENRKKLEAALQSYSGINQWQIKLSKGGEKDSGINLQQREDEKRQQQLQEKQESINNHPAIKSLQKVFPGSKIDQIKIKEN